MSEQTYHPSEALRRLDRLIGTWRVTGGAEGTVTFEWLDGGYFLLQRVDLEHDGHRIRGLEIIGHERPFGEKPSDEITSRFYGAGGETFDYVYEIEGDTLTIWGGHRGSPAYYRGRLSDDGNSAVGAWVYPGGGGYESSMARVE
jgi:hypothetical protein